MRIIFWLAVVLFSGGCASTDLINPGSDEATAIATQVYYGTDRNLQDDEKPSRFYGLKRGSLTYGMADVSIAQRGEKVTLEQVTPLPREGFLEHLRGAVQSAQTPTAMVFVHGFNRSFHQVSKLAADFATATAYTGVTLIWSWPSSRNPAGYLEDEANLRWSHPHMVQFLRDVIEQSGAEIVHLIGHSMGARGMTDAMLRDLLPGGIDRSKIGEYVLLAPDIDAAIFKRDLAPQLVAAGLHTTLYTSANDKALASAYGLRRYPRAGDSSYGPVLAPGVETIDVTAANKSILGHSYFDESDDVNADLATLLNHRQVAAERRNLVRIETRNGVYWQLLVED